MVPKQVTVIGGGLAGCEAAWQAAEAGCQVVIYDMKPLLFSPAHSSPNLAELVCSNSFRSNDPHSAIGLLKEEMRQLGSLIMSAAAETQVPAGKALAVDRDLFSQCITDKITAHPAISLERQEVTSLPEPSSSLTILATGPLTSNSMAESLAHETDQDHLAFYDAIAPIVSKDSLDMDIIYRASRYDDGPGDYLNCPMNKEEYTIFIEALSTAEKVALKSFEKKKYFEGCLPIEVMCERGENTLRFGPMKPVGLPNPRTGKDPYAVVQLRQEDRGATYFNMVGFQTKLTYSEQKRVFQLIPGMKNADFVRLGSIHRNTFVKAPAVLTPYLQLKTRPDIMLAGQITGVEGYIESTAIGLLAGINAGIILDGKEPLLPPPETALGALIHHLSNTETKHFQPSNINFGLFPPLPSGKGKKIPKRMRGRYRSELALSSLQSWIEKLPCRQGAI